jgi:hypothetical protein
MMLSWTGRIAPLGITSLDGRLLEPDGRWKFDGPVPLVTADADRRRVGEVRTLTVTGDEIRAAGTVDDADVAERMRSGELRPALEFGESSQASSRRSRWRRTLARRPSVDEGDGALVATMRFRSGRVAAIAVVEVPAWTDVWFDVAPQAAS